MCETFSKLNSKLLVKADKKEGTWRKDVAVYGESWPTKLGDVTIDTIAKWANSLIKWVNAMYIKTFIHIQFLMPDPSLPTTTVDEIEHHVDHAHNTSKVYWLLFIVIFIWLRHVLFVLSFVSYKKKTR